MFKLLTPFLITLFFISCSDTKHDRLITSWSDDINRSNLVIPTQQNLQIEVYAYYDDGSKENVSQSMIWSSSDITTATVENGLISAQSTESEVDISYKTNEKFSDGTPIYKTTTTFKIQKLTLNELTISPSSLKLYTTKSAKLIATAAYEENSNTYPNYNCNWSSANENIVTVDTNGLVQALAEGNATITAYDGDINTTSIVEVIDLTYISLKIKEPKQTTFNVEQTIELVAQGTTDKNITLDLNSSEVVWHSDNTECISIDADGLATAKSKCDSLITASLSTNTTLNDSLTLSVLEDEYLRIFKDDVEISFPYLSSSVYEEIPDELSTFKLIAVGRDFILGDISVKNFSNDLLTTAYFDILNSSENLTTGYVIKESDELEFELMHDGSENELHYFFSIDDKLNSSFSQKYLKEIP